MVKKYQEVLATRNYKSSTIKRIAQHSKHFIKWSNGHDIKKINYSDIENYLIDLQKAGSCEKTINNRLSSIKGYFDYLVIHGEIQENPVRIVRRIKNIETIPLYLPDDEIKILYKLGEMHNISNEITLALNTGLRMNELRHLRWKDIDTKRKQLLVQGEHLKGKQPRTIPLNEKSLKAIKKQKELYSKYDFVFPGGTGGKNRSNLWTKNAKRSYKWWLRTSLDPIRNQIPTIANIPKGNTCRGWHIMRHTFATRLAKAGIDVIKIKKWMGHQNINTTMRYIHLANQYDSDIEVIA